MRGGAVGAEFSSFGISDQMSSSLRSDKVLSSCEVLEAVEEMEERYARLKRRRLRDQCRVMASSYVGRGNNAVKPVVRAVITSE